MNKTPPALLAAALASTIAGSALAEPLTGLLEWQVSADGGATWSSSIVINPGDSYQIRARASWTDDGLGRVGLGVAGCTFEQIDLIGADSTDTFGGASIAGGVLTYVFRQQVVAETWSLQAGTGASASGLKIDNFTDPAVRRTSLSQLPKIVETGGPPHTGFRPDNPFGMLVLDAVAGGPKVITVSSTWTRTGTPPTNEFKVYTTEDGMNKKPIHEAARTDAHVWIRSHADCAADFTGDGIVDFSDYLAFVTFYDGQDFRADLNHDSFVDFSDYLEFLTAYDTGC